MSSNNKKQKSKARLDKFYHLAKDTGYRSRAAFKLIQMNKKYKFLENANSLVDLCAAPGSWLQVAEKYMPMQSVKIGVDLVPINGIPNTKTFVQDITHPECAQLILKEMQRNGLQKVDVVLNDGAPNVGANWAKDAYTQIELVLEGFKLATKILKRGGIFITKVFRSSDYSSLIWVVNKFFKKVEACKPEASRNQSAEIFLVCQEYLHPDYIDDKFFDSKFVFKDNEYTFSNSQIEGEINSIDKLFEKRRKRQGYSDDAPQSLYQVCQFDTLLNAKNPFPIFYTYSKVNIDQEQLNQFVQLGVKQPNNVVELLDDIQVLGKRDVAILVKWIKKIRFLQNKTRKQSINDEQDDDDDDDNYNQNHEDHDNADNKNEGYQITQKEETDEDEKLEKIINERKQKEENRMKKKEEKQLFKIAKAKQSSLNMINGDEETELFNLQKHKKQLNQIGYIDSDDEKNNIELENLHEKNKGKLKVRNIQEIEDNIDYLYNEKQNKDKAYKENKQQEQIQKFTKNKDGRDFDEKYIKAKQFLKDENKKDVLEDMEDLKQQKSVMNKKWFDQQTFQDLKKKIGESRAKFNNPLKQDEGKYNKQEQQQQMEEEDISDEYDDSSEDGRQKLEKKSKKIKKQKGNKNLDRFNDSEEEKEQKGKQAEDYDFDDLAENLALAKKMIRKKHREKIIDSTYNRYSYNDEDSSLPSWFLDDEKKHNVLNLPITKEEVQIVKERLMAINSRQPKKVLEAKWRKKIKLTRKLQKAKNKAEAVFEQEELSTQAKMKQIRSIYRKELKQKKDEKKYIVSKSFKSGGAKGGKNVRFVDRKLKGDKKMEKRAEKKKQLQVNPNKNINRKSKKIHKNRKKRK